MCWWKILWRLGPKWNLSVIIRWEKLATRANVKIKHQEVLLNREFAKKNFDSNFSALWNVASEIFPSTGMLLGFVLLHSYVGDEIQGFIYSSQVPYKSQRLFAHFLTLCWWYYLYWLMGGKGSDSVLVLKVSPRDLESPFLMAHFPIFPVTCGEVGWGMWDRGWPSSVEHSDLQDPSWLSNV